LFQSWEPKTKIRFPRFLFCSLKKGGNPQKISGLARCYVLSSIDDPLRIPVPARTEKGHVMQSSILQHYRAFGPFTYPGLYQERLVSDLPADIRDVGRLVRLQLIHKMTLYAGRSGHRVNPAYGDVNNVPWYRQGEDDYFPTVAAMLAELYRRDSRGLVADRAVEHKLILTCRFVALLMAAILKARGIAARVRPGYAPYIHPERIEDHWITQYWQESEQRWITIDVDTSFEQRPFDAFDMQPTAFEFAAQAWLAVRAGTALASAYRTYGDSALPELATQVVCDLHCLMNNEITYTQYPAHVASDFEGEKLQVIDALARLLLEPDENFTQLQTIWETNRDFRLLKGSLI
jgi:hypothetical protein